MVECACDLVEISTCLRDGRSGDLSGHGNDDTHFNGSCDCNLTNQIKYDRENENMWLRHYVQDGQRLLYTIKINSWKKKTIEMQRFENRRRMKAAPKKKKKKHRTNERVENKSSIYAMKTNDWCLRLWIECHFDSWCVFPPFDIQRERKTQLFDYRPVPNQIFLAPLENNG